MPPVPWKTRSSKPIYANKWIASARGHRRDARRTHDDTEFFAVAVFPFAEVLEMVVRSEIRDGMTVIAVLHAARPRGQPK